MTKQDIIQGDALRVLSGWGRPDPFDLVIFDPPAMLPSVDTTVALDYAHYLSTIEAALFFFGVNPNVLVREVGDSLWQIRRLFTLVGKDNLPRGHVVYARKENSRRQSFDSRYQTVTVTGEKGVGQHSSSKPECWFEWIFDCQDFENVLDPFAGLAPVGRICKRKGISYLGVEIDQETAQEASERLSEAPDSGLE